MLLAVLRRWKPFAEMEVSWKDSPNPIRTERQDAEDVDRGVANNPALLTAADDDDRPVMREGTQPEGWTENDHVMGMTATVRRTSKATPMRDPWIVGKAIDVLLSRNRISMSPWTSTDED